MAKFIKVLFWLCLIVFVIALFVFAIQCIISTWWNILFLLLILFTLLWYIIRRKNQKSVWQGVFVIILSLILLAWFIIPCIFGHFEDLERKAENEAQTTNRQILNHDEQHKEKKQQVENEKEEQEEREKEQQACLNIRGNISGSGERIYHVPSGKFYDKTKPEETFCTEAEAKAAGFRKSKL